MKNKDKKLLSFTRYEAICKDHISTDNRLCFCARTGKICNKMNCPKFRDNNEDELG